MSKTADRLRNRWLTWIVAYSLLAGPLFLPGCCVQELPEAARMATGAAAAEELNALPAAGEEEERGKKRPTTWKRSRVVPNASRLTVGDKEELPLKAMEAKVRIDGFRARVLLDCFYFNTHDRRLEGRFQMRLPNGASPFFFAFGATAVSAPEASSTQSTEELTPEQEARQARFEREGILADREEKWADPKEARIVPKERAAFAYGETVRRRVDPALAEWAGAGIFNARVFPLEPNKLHRIVIGYDMDLLPVGDDLQYRLDLPTDAPECVVSLNVADLTGATATVEPDIKPTRQTGRLHFYFKQPSQRSITLRMEDAGPVMLVGKDDDTGSYFAAAFRPDLPAARTAAGAANGIFLLDASLSSNPDRFNIWLKLTQAILEKNRDSMKQFAVLFFNVEALWWQQKFVPNTPANVRALMAFADKLALEGATDLGAALREAGNPGWLQGGAKRAKCDLFLLSDGAVTWGEGDLYALSKAMRSPLAGPLFAYRTGLAGTATRTLQHLTRESGGAVFSVVGESQIAEAAVAHRSRPWQLARVELAGGSDLLLAGRPGVVFAGQRLMLAGRGEPGPGAEVKLTLRQGGQEQIVTTSFAAPLASELAGRAYGQIAVGQLEDFGMATQEYATAYATHFRVTGQTCSLVMLESEEDYQRFNIKPQENAFVVKRHPAGPIVAKALQQIGESLGDSKAAFMAWLKRLERMPGIEFRVPTALRMAVEAMPAEAFAVTAPSLVCKQHNWRALPGMIQEQLAARKLDYDDITAEAERRQKELGAADALKALSSLVESRPGDGVLARDVGFAAMQWGLGAHAVGLFRRVAEARPYEPQTYRALAECLTGMGKADLAMAYYEVALTGQWPNRFGEFRRIVGLDYLRFLRRVADGELSTSVPEYARARLRTVGSEFDVGKADLLVTITWNTDRTDIDLHVIEPGGEECYYKHPKTKIGGRLTRDVTTGYGPEMYLLAKAPDGKYRIRVKYYGTDRNRLGARTKVYATVIEGWGTKHERVTRHVIALAEERKMHDVLTVTVKK